MLRILSDRRWRAALSNAALALFYAAFVYSHLQAFAAMQRPSILLLVAVESIILAMVLVRRDADATWHSCESWLTTFGGTFAPLMFRPTGAPDDLLVAQLLQVAGVFLQIGAICALNRSFGLLPAHRGLKSGGLYRFVRHPLYAAYMLVHVGYVLNNMSGYNVAIFIAATGLQVMRIRSEETFLMRYDEYADYARRTRWRLIPAVW